MRAVLTTEVIPWARGAVREIDIARRLMYHAVHAPDAAQGRGRPAADGEGPRDPGVRRGRAAPAPRGGERLQLPHLHRPDTITVFNDELFVRGTDIQEIFAQLGVDEATHAFYLGRELAKAQLAITLGKTYRQEGAAGVGLPHAAGRRAVRARQADAAHAARPDAARAPEPGLMVEPPRAAGRQSGHRGRPDRGRVPLPRPSLPAVPRQRHRRHARRREPPARPVLLPDRRPRAAWCAARAA